MKWQHLFIWFCAIALVTVTRAQDEEDDFGDVETEPDAPEAGTAETEKEFMAKPQYVPPQVKGNAHFAEAFDSPSDFEKKWIKSEAKKDDTDEAISKYDGKWALEPAKTFGLEGDLGLVLKSRAKHHAISAKLDKPFTFSGKQFVIQYEVKFQEGIECGGAYVKLLSDSPNLNLKNFVDKTPFTVMFGPDKCGMDYKLHFIFRHKNPKTGAIEEKHAKKPTDALEHYYTDKRTHLYTLVVNSDNSFEIYIDQELINSGSLLEDVTPAVNPPKEIEDPNDKKPADWDEKEKIPDPDATKPDDWDEDEPEMIPDEEAEKPEGWLDDEQELIPDPDAEKPQDWDEDMDGEWEPPMINNPACEDAPGCGEWKRPTKKNPAYKGKWRAPMIDNPNYKGKWKPRQIPNPDFFEDLTPYKMTPISAVGLELWTMTEDILFDNFILTDSKLVADDWAADTWEIKREYEFREFASKGKSVVDGILDITRDRPWLWAVFILVVLLPIVLVIAYCCMGKSEKPGFFQRLMDAAEERKWLWGVYAFVILIPVVVLSVIFCPTKGPLSTEEFSKMKKEDDEREEAERKEQEEIKESSEDNAASGDASTVRRRKTKKSDLEEEDKNEDADEEVSQEEEEEEESKGNKSPRKSPRKRKARKD